MDTPVQKLFVSKEQADDFIDIVMPLDKDYGVISAAPVATDDGYLVRLCVERGYDKRSIRDIIDKHARGHVIEIKSLGGRAVSHVGQSNPTGYWFKRRRYGWGWTPANRQGWLITGVYLFCLIGGAVAVTESPRQETPLVNGIYFVLFILMTVVFLAACIRHSPPPKWRWGRKPDDNPDEDF